MASAGLPVSSCRQVSLHPLFRAPGTWLPGEQVSGWQPSVFPPLLEPAAVGPESLLSEGSGGGADGESQGHGQWNQGPGEGFCGPQGSWREVELHIHSFISRVPPGYSDPESWQLP